MPDSCEPFDTGLSPRDVDPARPRSIETPWGPISIFSCARGLFAVQSFCPHLGGPLFQGSVSGETVTCPWHQWRFSLATGRRLDLEGRPHPGGESLLVCSVRLGARGALVLCDPRRAGVL